MCRFSVETEFKTLFPDLRTIFTNQSISTLGYETLYRAAFRIIFSHKQGDRLYRQTKTLVGEVLVTKVQPDVLASATAFEASEVHGLLDARLAGEDLMIVLKKSWREFRPTVEMAYDVLFYMVSIFDLQFNRKGLTLFY
jgi:hypothetical protein